MAVKIRISRKGKKNQPFYRIVAADKESPRDGRFIEQLGTYDPTINPAVVKFEEERILYWLSKGAEPTDTVKQLLKREGIWTKHSEKKVS